MIGGAGSVGGWLSGWLAGGRLGGWCARGRGALRGRPAAQPRSTPGSEPSSFKIAKRRTSQCSTQTNDGSYVIKQGWYQKHASSRCCYIWIHNDIMITQIHQFPVHCSGTRIVHVHSNQLEGTACINNYK